MGELRREYPILYPYASHKTSILTAGPEAGGDYTQSGEALFDLVWRRISGGTLTVATELARKKQAHAVELLEAAKKHAEEAPMPPEPEPKGEMVRMVLVGYGPTADKSCNLFPVDSAYGFARSETGPGRKAGACFPRTMLGVYLAPPSTSLCNLALADALEQIRGAGGEWIAGEPLPEPVEETFPAVRLSGRAGWYWACTQCGDIYQNRPPSFCYSCKSPLSGTVPWDPTAYRNRGC